MLDYWSSKYFNKYGILYGHPVRKLFVSSFNPFHTKKNLKGIGVNFYCFIGKANNETDKSKLYLRLTKLRQPFSLNYSEKGTPFGLEFYQRRSLMSYTGCIKIAV